MLRSLYSFFWILLTAFDGIYHQIFKKAPNYSLPSLQNKVIIVTGGNRGIGFETALALAEKGAQVIIACRDTRQGILAASKIKVLSRNDKVEVMELDLSSLQSVRAFVEAFKARNLPLHVLVNNAGVMFGPYVKTKDGFENQLAVNHLGHFLLTVLLLPLLDATSGRIVVVASAAHVYGTINFDDLQSEKFYSPYAAYMQSKLANIMFTYELYRRLKANGSNVTVNAVHPGMVSTDLWRHSNWIIALLSLPLLPFYKNARGGANTVIYLAAHPDVEGMSGKYFAECREIHSSVASYNREYQKRLWQESARLVGADYPVQ